MNYPILLLDIDGTLIDFYKSYHSAAKKVLEFAGCPVTEENLNIYLKCNDDAWENLDCDNVDRQYIRENYHRLYHQYITDAASEARTRLNLHQSTKALGERYVYEWGHCAVPSPNAVEICRKLSATHTLCIASNGLTDLQMSKLTEFKSYIAHYFISEDINHIKPEKEYFDFIFKKLKCNPSDCIMVGDSLRNDIRGAKESGIATCYYNPLGNANHTDIIPDFEIKNFSELLKIVEN